MEEGVVKGRKELGTEGIVVYIFDYFCRRLVSSCGMFVFHYFSPHFVHVSSNHSLQSVLL